MEDQLRRKLLSLARKTLENEFNHSKHQLDKNNIPELQDVRGLFVTLMLKGNLRGCIGRIEAHHSLYQNTIDLSKSAAFEDHRFEPLTAKELSKVIIEISILSEPREIEGLTSYEKILKIKPKKDGVILSAEGKNATFLPQVWDSIPIREDFISDLCRKANLPRNYWQSNDMKISVYQVEHFHE